MEDLISRQAAIDAAARADYTGLAVEDVKKVTYEVIKELKKLPSVDRTGEWEHDVDGHFFCTNCEKYPEYQIRMSDYCPNCGADMRGGNNE